MAAILRGEIRTRARHQAIRRLSIVRKTHGVTRTVTDRCFIEPFRMCYSAGSQVPPRGRSVCERDIDFGEARLPRRDQERYASAFPSPRPH